MTPDNKKARPGRSNRPGWATPTLRERTPMAPHQERAQTATQHTDQLTKLLTDLNTHLDNVYEGAPAHNADAVLVRIIAAAEDARAALTSAA